MRLRAEISISVALAIVLGLITKLIQLPYGGSVNLSALPILLMALRRGVKIGSLTGVLYGFIALLLNPYVFHPIQIIVDYPLAFGMLGAAGMAWIGYDGNFDPRSWEVRLRAMAGILVGNGLRLLAHFLSGIVFFAEYAPEGQPVWLYSLSYNSSYIIPETIIGILLVQFMLRFVMEIRTKGV